jgi:hypothetical protein
MQNRYAEKESDVNRRWAEKIMIIQDLLYSFCRRICNSLKEAKELSKGDIEDLNFFALSTGSNGLSISLPFRGNFNLRDLGSSNPTKSNMRFDRLNPEDDKEDVAKTSVDSLSSEELVFSSNGVDLCSVMLSGSSID